MTKIPYILTPLVGVLLLLLMACGSGPAEKPIVTVSIEPQRYLVERIAGDRMQVRCLLADGANPETYDPSVTHMINLQKSSAFLRVGKIGFVAALIDKIHDSNPDLPIFNTSEGIVPVTGTHAHGPHADADETVDPHTWTSVRNARIMARNIANALSQIDPQGERRYRRNLEVLDAHLDSLDHAIAARLAPVRGKAFLVWHPSLSYFARDYGLEQVIVGGHENKESSVGSMRDAIDHARSHGAEVFFSQQDLDKRHVSALNNEIGAREVSINPLSSHWEEEMIRIADALDPHTTASL